MGCQFFENVDFSVTYPQHGESSHSNSDLVQNHIIISVFRNIILRHYSESHFINVYRVQNTLCIFQLIVILRHIAGKYFSKSYVQIISFIVQWGNISANIMYRSHLSFYSDCKPHCGEIVL